MSLPPLGRYAAKVVPFGVGGLTRVAALDYAAAGIRVNAIAPGPILTSHLAAAGKAARAGASAVVPLGRVGHVAATYGALQLPPPPDIFVTKRVRLAHGGLQSHLRSLVDPRHLR